MRIYAKMLLFYGIGSNNMCVCFLIIFTCILFIMNLQSIIIAIKSYLFDLILINYSNTKYEKE